MQGFIQAMPCMLVVLVIISLRGCAAAGERDLPQAAVGLVTLALQNHGTSRGHGNSFFPSHALPKVRNPASHDTSHPNRCGPYANCGGRHPHRFLPREGGIAAAVLGQAPHANH